MEQQLADGSKGSRIPVALMWVQQHYAIRPPSRITRNDTITFQTVRGLRSAASSLHRLDMQTAFPGAVIQDRSQRVIAVRHCSPTDELSYTMMSQGMASRLGEDSNPSQELLAIRTFDASQYINANVIILYITRSSQNHYYIGNVRTLPVALLENCNGFSSTHSCKQPRASFN